MMCTLHHQDIDEDERACLRDELLAEGNCECNCPCSHVWGTPTKIHSSFDQHCYVNT